MPNPFGLAEIREAQESLKGILTPTPLQYAANLSDLFNAEVYLKLECFQPVKSFKIRGAYNKIYNLREQEKERGLVTASSGNHGIAVAYVAKLLKINATICVPSLASENKISSIKKLGATVIENGANYDEAYLVAQKIQGEMGSILVHPFDDPKVVAGQGTIGLEILEQLPATNMVIVPIGGGGLISGIACALKNINSKLRVLGVQSNGAPSMYNCVKAGKIVNTPIMKTIADGLATKKPSNLTFESVLRYVDDLKLVSDGEIEKAVIMLLHEENILAEPSGSASLAAFSEIYRLNAKEKIVLIISGGNISKTLLETLLPER